MNKLQAYSCVFMLFGIIGGSILILNGDILSGIIFGGVVTLWGYLDYKYDLKKCISNFFNDDKDVADDELYLDEK